tara:strand:- start:922 stop:3069 length:2148 start_codon:yes stop_codon:yes gene_type:complete
MEKNLMFQIQNLRQTMAYKFMIFILLIFPLLGENQYIDNVSDKYDVEILRDTWGVPHIYGVTDEDVAFGFAFAHCEDDFKTIQDVILQTRGKLSSVYGVKMAPIDYMTNLLRVRENVNKNYDDLISEDVKSVIDAYVDGLNYYSYLHPSESIKEIYPISAEDIVAGFVFRTQFLYGLDFYFNFLYGSKNEKEQPNLPRKVWRDTAPLGSNSFAVSPNRTEDENTFLLVNAHQPWDGPIAWYEVHLHSEEGWNMMGGTLPGSPVVFVGHNDNLGWAHTLNLPDLIDIYELTINPDDNSQYLFDGNWVDFDELDSSINLKLLKLFNININKKIRWSIHGPVLDLDHGVYAIRYAAMSEIRQVEQWFRMNKAKNFDEWESAMKLRYLPSLNCMYGDKEGNIFYLYNAAFPDRNSNYDWKNYLPGDTSETLWTDVLEYESLPKIYNPHSGFLQNCNSTPFESTIGDDNPNPIDFPEEFGIETHMTNRALRAIEMFSTDLKISQEDIFEYKFDMKYSENSAIAKYRYEILNADLPIDDPTINEAVKVLREWDLNTNPDNKGAALAILSTKPYLKDYYEKISESELVENFIEAANLLKKKYGEIDVSWGSVNRMIRGRKELSLGGGPDIMHSIYGNLKRNGELEAFAGDSYILFITWDQDGKVSSKSVHQYGAATTNKKSPHYSDQATLFANRQLKDVWFNKKEILENLESRYKPGGNNEN